MLNAKSSELLKLKLTLHQVNYWYDMLMGYLAKDMGAPLKGQVPSLTTLHVFRCKGGFSKTYIEAPVCHQQLPHACFNI